MPEYDVFLSHVIPQAPGCPDITALQEASNVLGIFCRDTYIWQDWADMYVDSAVDEYNLIPPAGASIVAVLRLVEGRKDMPSVNRSPPGVDVDYDGVPKGSVSDGWHFVPPDKVRMVSLPSKSGILFARAVLQPALDAQSFPDWIWQIYSHALVSGVLSRLFVQHGMQWSNPGLAGYHEQAFRKGVNRAKYDLATSHSNHAMRVKPRRFV